MRLLISLFFALTFIKVLKIFRDTFAYVYLSVANVTLSLKIKDQEHRVMKTYCVGDIIQHFINSLQFMVHCGTCAP